MNVFVNDAVQPTLTVEELLADAQQGGVQFHGPAAFANLVISPGETRALSPKPIPASTGNASGIVHS